MLPQPELKFFFRFLEIYSSFDHLYTDFDQIRIKQTHLQKCLFTLLCYVTHLI